ncbi:MAG TPA: GGDEF domain-containing protein, partial [Solirubrobacteraceae bacterium]
MRASWGHIERGRLHVRTPSLRENALGVGSFTTELAARAQAYLFAAACIVGALGVALPHPASFNEAGMLAVQIGSIATAGVMFALGGRVPGWMITISPFCAALLTSVVLTFTGDSSSAYLLFYLWVAFYAFYFLSRRGAALLASFTLVNYAVVLLGFRLWGVRSTMPTDNEDVAALVLIACTVVVAGVFIVLLRERVGRLIRQLTDAASTDPLTGLLNRRGFHRALETELARAGRNGRAFSVLLGDCDYFKQLNDRLGHHAGDEALLAIGRMLEETKRRIDVTARIGGEEFALVLPETDQHEAYLTGERMRMRFAEIFSERPTPLTMSFGVATYPDHGATDDDLLRAADEALYAAKALGRDRTVLH